MKKGQPKRTYSINLTGMSKPERLKAKQKARIKANKAKKTPIYRTGMMNGKPINFSAKKGKTIISSLD
jgi:hypothetical protein